MNAMLHEAKPATKGQERIERIRVQNFRALKSMEMRSITPLTVLVGPNGSGKSTVFDVFNFLSECFQFGLRYAWDRRGRARELKTRGQNGPVAIELQYREAPRRPIITYRLAVEEGDRGPYVAEEWLQWRRGHRGKPFRFLDFRRGTGKAVSGEMPDERDKREDITLRSADLLAVSTLGQFEKHPRAAALREFISDWYVSYLSTGDMRGQPEAGPQERLSKTGDNLPNVIQHLMERHPERLNAMFDVLRERVPRLDRVLAETMQNGQLLLLIKDAPFDKPILSRFASDGTLKMLSYLTLLHDPEPPRFIGIEEPENFLHPRLLAGLAEECRRATSRSQVLATTHSPFLLNAVRPDEVRVLYRDEQGYAQMMPVVDIPGVREFFEAGDSLGHLWMEGHFGVGDPLVNAGAPRNAGGRR